MLKARKKGEPLCIWVCQSSGHSTPSVPIILAPGSQRHMASSDGDISRNTEGYAPSWCSSTVVKSKWLNISQGMTTKILMG